MIIDITRERVEWKLAGTDFLVKELERELREQGMPKLYDELEAKPIEELEAPSRAARNTLGLQIADARSIKKRMRCETIRQLVELYELYKTSYKLDRFKAALKDCLINERKTE